MASTRWQLRNDSLVAEVTLAGFAQVRLLIEGLMDLAERLDHHPEVAFGYRQVRITWTTHDAGGVSAKDEAAAAASDALIDALLR